MIFRVFFKNLKDFSITFEENIISVDEVKTFIKKILKKWNTPEQIKTRVIGIEIIKKKGRPKHTWEEHGPIDDRHKRYRCRDCGIFSRTYGACPGVVRYRKYKDEKYKYCDESEKCKNGTS